MQIQAKFRIYKKRHRGYEWENAYFIVKREDAEKLRHLDNKEVTIIIANSDSTVENNSTVDSAKLQKYIKALKLLNNLLAKATNKEELLLSLSDEEAEFLIRILEEVNSE